MDVMDYEVPLRKACGCWPVPTIRNVLLLAASVMLTPWLIAFDYVFLTHDATWSQWAASGKVELGFSGLCALVLLVCSISTLFCSPRNALRISFATAIAIGGILLAALVCLGAQGFLSQLLQEKLGPIFFAVYSLVVLIELACLISVALHSAGAVRGDRMSA